MEKFQKVDEEKFKKIIHQRKENNKYEKQQSQKKKTEFLVNMKKEKAEERMHRLIVKGRKVIEHRIINKGPKKRKTSTSLKKDNDEVNMLFYDVTD